MRSKTLTTITLAGWLLVLTGIPAAAQLGSRLTAEIPFEFAAGTKTMPAGEYTLTLGGSSVSPALVVFQAANGKAAVQLLASAAESAGAAEQTKLIFHRHGDRHFLVEIWTRGVNRGYQFPQSQSERELTKQAANFEVVALVAQR
jgi:hypothetical protein